MTPLNRSTCRRLQQLVQIPSIWEGDRRPLGAEPLAELGSETGRAGDCILWVDGSQSMVRAMDMVAPDMGSEAIVRTLLRAMEHPHSPARPARPQKIVVRDREVQFFLRGVLQDLDIVVDYEPELPLIDEIFRGFQEVVDSRPPRVPPSYAELLNRQAYEIWADAPWDHLGEHQILAVELNQWDIGTLYVSVMGMMGMEYGVLMYRSLDSLRQFRQHALNEESFEQMEAAFLRQDCLFLTFEQSDTLADEDEDGIDLAELSLSEIQPSFGNLHPLEGLRSFLHEEEAIVLSVILESLHRFFRQHRSKLSHETLEALSSRYRIPVPQPEETLSLVSQSTKPQQISVQVSTLPEVAQELLAMLPDEDEDGMDFPVLRDDLIPEGALCWLGFIPWETIEVLRQQNGYQPADAKIPVAGDGLPVVLIQTSQPKGKTLIEALKASEGLQSICFNPGEDPLTESSYDLGLFQTGNGELHLFAEFLGHDSSYSAARKKWEQRCKKTKGYCGLVIAKGITGASRGNPQMKDMMALLEGRYLTAEELGLGPLELNLEIDWI